MNKVNRVLLSSDDEEGDETVESDEDESDEEEDKSEEKSDDDSESDFQSAEDDEDLLDSSTDRAKPTPKPVVVKPRPITPPAKDTGAKPKKSPPQVVTVISSDEEADKENKAAAVSVPTKTYTIEQVRDLESQLESKHRALASNLKMLKYRSDSLPDGGKKLRAYVDQLEAERDAVQFELAEAMKNCSSGDQAVPPPMQKSAPSLFLKSH